MRIWGRGERWKDGHTGSSPHPPVMVWTSDPQTPQHSLTISTSFSSKCLGVNYISSVSKAFFKTIHLFSYQVQRVKRGRERGEQTFCLVKSLHFSEELIMNPSNCSGAAI